MLIHANGTQLTVRWKQIMSVCIYCVDCARAFMQQQDEKSIMRFMVIRIHSHFWRPFQLIALTAGWPLSSWFSITFHADCGQTVWNPSSWNTIVSVYISQSATCNAIDGRRIIKNIDHTSSCSMKCFCIQWSGFYPLGWIKTGKISSQYLCKVWWCSMSRLMNFFLNAITQLCYWFDEFQLFLK